MYVGVPAADVVISDVTVVSCSLVGMLLSTFIYSSVMVVKPSCARLADGILSSEITLGLEVVSEISVAESVHWKMGCLKQLAIVLGCTCSQA